MLHPTRRLLIGLMTLGTLLFGFYGISSRMFSQEALMPWYNKTYDGELAFSSYAVHPMAEGMLAALERQAMSRNTFTFPEAWALPAFGELRENIVIEDWRLSEKAERFSFKENLVAPAYKLATCQIEKVMTTVRDAMFCYLNNPAVFTENAERLSAHKWTASQCGWENYRSDIDEVEREWNTKFLRFAIIRDPFERFLSAYTDKCIKEVLNFKYDVRCLACKGDIRCFIERLFHLLYGMSYNRTYISKEIWYIARHFGPQSWQCNFKKQLKSYRLIVYPEGWSQTASVAREISHILRDAQVPQEMRYHIRKELSAGRSDHSTSDTNERRYVRQLILSNRYLRRLIALIYYFDYVVFGFRLPEWFFD